jgi:hypothetical protein
MTVVQGLISNVGFLTGPAAGKGTYFESVWDAFSKIVDHGEEPSWGERIIAILYWAIGIAVSGTIIGFITSRIQRLVQVLRKGRSPVVESGHTLILGWSPRIFPILAELAIANENVRRPLVVVFADRDREAMQDEIAALRDQLASTSSQLVQTRAAGLPPGADKPPRASNDGGVPTTPVVMQSAMTQLKLPDLQPRFDGAVVRIDIPADRLAKMERSVTSEEWKLRKEFRDLEGI